MRVFELYTANALEMIAEANVMNVKDEYQGISIHSFLNNYLDGFSTKEAKQMWLKKLSKLFINDERFLNAVREVPADAPEWAQKAAADGDLFFFQPTDELKDKMDHMSHYVAGLEADAKGNNPDAKAHANRELQGFIKAENLDTLIKKSDEYFKRGSKKAGRDIEGMKKILDVTGGYSWWKLEDQAAYAREGKALQNCIGTHWTKTKADKSGYSIVVMKNPNMESVVAARINNKENELHEMKGKNNKPPIPKYMPGVQEMINKFKLNLGSAGYDLKRAGYYYKDQTLYTKAQAVRDLIDVKPIDKLGPYVVNQVVSDNYELMYDLYNTTYSSYRSTDPEDVEKVYDLRGKDNTPMVSAVVDKGELQRLHRYVQPTINQGSIREAAQTDKRDTVTREFLSLLMRKGLIKTVTPQLQRELFWNDKMSFNPDSGDFEDTKPDADVVTDKKHHKWQVYSSPHLVKDLANSLKKDYYYSSEEKLKKQEGDFLKHVKHIYTTTAAKATGEQGKETDKILVIAADDRGNMAPYVVRGSDISHAKSVYQDDGAVDERTLNSMIALANEKGLRVPKTIQIRQGVGKDKDGKFSRDVLAVKPEKMAGDLDAKKWDFSKIPDEDRLAAIVRAITTDVRTNKDHWTGTIDEFGISMALKKFVTGQAYGDWNDADFNWGDTETKAWLDKHFNGQSPDGMISADVGYGHERSHAINMLTRGNKIIQIDDESKSNNWQKWDDYETITKQLNDMAKANGLTFAKDAAKKSKEFRVDKQGQIRPQAELKKEQIEKLRAQGRYAKEGTDELPYADGWKLKRMNPDQQGRWLRQGLEKLHAGEAWYLEDPEGSTPLAFFVSKGKITQMYHTPTQQREETEAQTAALGARSKAGITLPTAKGPNKRLLPHVKAAAEKFGWSSGPQMSFSPRNRVTAVLQDYARRGLTGRRRWSLRPTEQILVNLGLLNIQRGRQRRYGGGYKDISISQRGREVVRHMTADTPVDYMDLVSSVAIDPEFRLPEKPAKPARQARAPRAPRARRAAGGQTKSQQALAKFTEMTNEKGRMPTRSEFIEVLMAEPFNMSKAGAQTYHYNTKKKSQQANEGLKRFEPLKLIDLWAAKLRAKD